MLEVRSKTKLITRHSFIVSHILNKLVFFLCTHQLDCIFVYSICHLLVCWLIESYFKDFFLFSGAASEIPVISGANGIGLPAGKDHLVDESTACASKSHL